MKTMGTETTLLLDLDERNLAHFLSALALAALARRVQVEGGAVTTIESRCCWWPKPGEFAIETELPDVQFREMLFTTAHEFLKRMEWHSGLGGPAYGILVSGGELGVNPFIALSGEAAENTPLKCFSARVLPGATLREQRARLQSPDGCRDWLNQFDRGAGSWGFDSRVNMHASDSGISSDAENSGQLDPFYPAVELLGLAAPVFFVPAHAWQVERNALLASAWTQRVPLSMAALAATARIHGLPARRYKFAYRGAAHGKGRAYHFFPPAKIQPSTP
jgi:hypothetical protein